jgi:hypothetical protein
MTIERGQVQAKEFTKNGKPKVKIGGNWYFAGRCDVSSLNAGQMIEFDWSEFGEPNERTGRKPRGLNNWGLINSAPASNGANGHAPSSALDDADRPFISNIVAHAIAAGLIKEPEQLEKWAQAAQGAMRALKGERPRQPPRQHDDLPGDMPESFYRDMPPPEEPPRGTRTW